MTFAEAIGTCLRKYATFSGRASRPEYWWFVAFVAAGCLVASTLDNAIFGSPLLAAIPGRVAVSDSSPLAALFATAMFLPALAAAWRRMHDTGRSGLFVFYPFIVMIGLLTFLGFASGFQPILPGDLAPMAASATGIIFFIATGVLVISPLLVLWWLTRPSQPGLNAYGPYPPEVTS